MKPFLLALLLISFQVHAQTAAAQPQTPQNPTLTDQSPNGINYLDHAAKLKEAEISSQVQVILTDCESDPTVKAAVANIPDAQKVDETKKAVQDCFKKKLSSQTNDEVEKLGQKLQLQTFNIIDSGDAKTVRSYLDRKVCLAFQNDSESACPKIVNESSKPIPLKETVFVDHITYGQLYESQIGKNILAEISGYCLDYVSLDSETKKIINAVSPKTGEEAEKRIKEEYAHGADFLKSKFEVCALKLDSFCQTPEDAFNGSASSDVKKIAGRKACIVKSKIASYRQTLKALETYKEQMTSLQTDGSGVGFNIGSTYKGKYDSSKNEELTTLTSKDAAAANTDLNEASSEKIYENKKDERIAGDFEKECMQTQNLNTSKCQGYIQTIKKGELANIQKKTAAVYDIKNEELDRLLKPKEDSDKIKKYLQDRGMKDLYDKYSSSQMDGATVIKTLKDKLNSEKEAVICDLNAKAGISDNCSMDKSEMIMLTDDEKVTDTNAKETIATNVKTQIEDRAKQQERLLNYTNIISSYLELQDSKGGSVGQNSFSRNLEQNTFKAGYSKENADKYFGQLDQGGSSGRMPSAEPGSGSTRSAVTFDFIDKVLGNITGTTSGSKSK